MSAPLIRRLAAWLGETTAPLRGRLDFELPRADRRLADRLSASPAAAALLAEAKALKVTLSPGGTWDQPDETPSTAVPGVRFHPARSGKGGAVSFVPGVAGAVDVAVLRALRLGVIDSADRNRAPLCPADRLRWQRLAMADAESLSVQAAAELRAAGKPAAWDQLLADPQRHMLAEAFVSAPAGAGRRAAFDAWFAQPTLVGATDLQTILTLEQKRHFWQRPVAATREFSAAEAVAAFGPHLAGGRTIDDPLYIGVRGAALQARLTALEHAQLVVLDKAAAKARGRAP